MIEIVVLFVDDSINQKRWSNLVHQPMSTMNNLNKSHLELNI